jgi:hypothetical protein
MAVTTTRADQYRQLARDFHLMARNLPPGEERSAMLKMAESPAKGDAHKRQAAEEKYELRVHATKLFAIKWCANRRKVRAALHGDLRS